MDNLLSFSTLDTAGDVNISFFLKFFRLARGTANELDDRIRARGNAASMIEVPLERNATQKDVYVENEELKASTAKRRLERLQFSTSSLFVKN